MSFSAQGAHVVAVGRRAAPLAETAAGRPGIEPLVADVTAPGAAELIVGTATQRHGRLDVLVNNAGVAGGGPLGSLAPETIERHLATNLVAPLLLAQAAVPALTDSRGSRRQRHHVGRVAGLAGQLAVRGRRSPPWTR